MTDPQSNFSGFSRRSSLIPGRSPSPETPTRPLSAASGIIPALGNTTPTNPSGPTQPQHSPNNPFVITHSTTLPTRSIDFGLPQRQAAQPSAPPQAPPQASTTTTTSPDLTTVLAMLAQLIQQQSASRTTPSPNSERHNVREPDQYDGTEPHKLRSFFTQLGLVFKARPRTFDTDEKQVIYAISFLKGTPLQWFEPYLLETNSPNPPDFLSDYQIFQEELRVNFGPYDVTESAEHDLENLHMSDNQKIAKYVTQFARLATQTRWGHDALRYQFYCGLPERLKDRISDVGKPDNLNDLRNLAQQLDYRYWERKAERSRDNSTSTKSNTNKSTSSASDNRSDSRSNNSNNSNRQQQKSSGSKSDNSSSKSNNSGSKTDNKSSPKPAYSDKLGKDGKLTNEERQRRFANNLCLFCGGAGHSARDCTKKSSSAAKARSAQAQPPPAPVAATPPAEPKN